MNLRVHELQTLAAEWKGARCMYPVYLGISERFQLEVPLCPELELPLDLPDSAVLEAVHRWFARVDGAVQVHQLRVFLQTSSLCSGDVLQELVRHHLRATESADDSDRDKLDFLLVQYFSQCAPSYPNGPTLEEVALVLRPVLGEVVPEWPVWASALENALERLGHCASMRELLQAEVLREVREIKASAGPEYSTRPALVTLTRFNYLLRQAFFRLMRADVEAVRQGVRELAGLGVSSIDCRRAGLSIAEPMVRVLRLCQQWRKPFQEEYSAGNPFSQLAELRAAVEEALSTSRTAAIHTVGDEAPQQLPLHLRACPEVQKLLACLPSHLNADPRSRQSGATIVSGGSRLVLSPAEVRAFADGAGPVQDLVRRAVACRLVLFQALEQRKRSGWSERLAPIVAVAKTEVEYLRGALAEARSQGRPAATLSAASKRLSDLLEKSGNS